MERQVHTRDRARDQADRRDHGDRARPLGDLEQAGRPERQPEQRESTCAVAHERRQHVADAARGSNEIAANIVSVAEAAQRTAEGAATTRVSAQSMGEMAEELAETVSRFETE